MEGVKALIAQKDELERTIQAGLDKLTLVGMDQPLIDEEGFPRSDVDVREMRITRGEVARMQNDHKELMKQIEAALHELHATARSQAATTAAPASSTNSHTTHSSEQHHDAASSTHAHSTDSPAFLRVDEMSPESPAAAAGVQVGDQVLAFGSITAHNFNGLQAISQLLTHSEGKKLTLKVQRGEAVHSLTLVPKTWSGRGLLGCKVVAV